MIRSVIELGFVYARNTMLPLALNVLSTTKGSFLGAWLYGDRFHILQVRSKLMRVKTARLVSSKPFMSTAMMNAAQMDFNVGCTMLFLKSCDKLRHSNKPPDGGKITNQIFGVSLIFSPA